MGSVLLNDQDLQLFKEGTHPRLFDKLGAHPVAEGGAPGVHFAVWAPNAREVSVIGEFNGWAWGANPLAPCADTGLWTGVVAGAVPGMAYKYAITSRVGDYRVEKADPFAFASEVRPKTASRVWDLSTYVWQDAAWMSDRARRHRLDAPITIYEVHLGSWRRRADEGNRWLSYRELAPLLADHVQRLNFTHVELLPITEHPFDGSWGYQPTGYFCPTSRFGTPDDFRYFIDHLHQRGIGVILDWVPGHFPTDAHGLSFFDGTHLYEHADPRQGFHPDWNTAIFNFGRPQVAQFLLMSARFWLDQYHLDGLRMDAVASMLYLDYSRKPGEWIPNADGGRENLEAVSFLRRFNEEVYRHYPDVVTIAEESTAWPMVSRPTYAGGLGFGLKWDMGWMHDTLSYLARSPAERSYHQHQLSFRMMYAFTENFILSLSHDEVVHGKGSLLARMPGDPAAQMASLRLLAGYQFTLPGKKLIFMGGEFAQRDEWSHDKGLDWSLLENPAHAGLLRWVADLSSVYAREPSLHEWDCESEGFEWIDCSDAHNSVLAFARKNRAGDRMAVVVCHFGSGDLQDYRIGIPWGGRWSLALNSESVIYGGRGAGSNGVLHTEDLSSHGRPQSLSLTLPAFSAQVFLSQPT